jgi:hypothetical protein
MNAIATLPAGQPAGWSQQNALVPRSVADALELASVMSKASLIPDHLRNKPGDCLLVIMQAQRWGMDAVSVAQCTSVVHGKLCYEGKLVAAALYSMGAVDGRLRYDFEGSGPSRTVTVTGRPHGSPVDQTVVGTVQGWQTSNDNWKKQPDDMLVYRGTRQWARRYAPEALLGVYTPDEIEDVPAATSTTTVTQLPAQPEQLPPYPADKFQENLPKWGHAMESGKKTAADIIAMVETKGALSEEQKAAIHDLAPVATQEAGA